MDDLIQMFLTESREGVERMERSTMELEQRPEDGKLIAEIFRAVHTIKGATGFLGLTRLGRLTHAGESLLSVMREGRVKAVPEVIGGLLELTDGVRQILGLLERTGIEGERTGDEDGALIAKLERMTSGEVERRAQQVVAAVERSSAGAAESVALAKDKTLRVEVEVLNRVMNLVGELVLTRNGILQGGSTAARAGAERISEELERRLDHVTEELRTSVMKARMQPVGQLFEKFPRMVRELAKECGRSVRIEFEGRETGLDKGLLEAVRDPLTHAIRNAVDHGIEPAEERVRAGKPAEGVVRLRAFQENGSVVIEVSDDGAGVSRERVLAKAVEQGLVSAGDAVRMTEPETMQLLFLPGFSTAQEVTGVSGRGVGMDVIRANLEKAGGSVEIESHVGVGTKMRMRVPLTLAIIPALVVRCAGESYAAAESALVELLYVSAGEAASTVEHVGGMEVVRLREGLLPLVHLSQVLEIEKNDASRGFYVMVAEVSGFRYGLVVDELAGPEEIVVKPLSAALQATGVYSGATVLGSGELAMILDVAAIARRAGVRPMETRFARANTTSSEMETAA